MKLSIRVKKKILKIIAQGSDQMVFHLIKNLFSGSGTDLDTWTLEEIKMVN